jgi:hypothetical protein
MVIHGCRAGAGAVLGENAVSLLNITIGRAVSVIIPRFLVCGACAGFGGLGTDPLTESEGG